MTVTADDGNLLIKGAVRINPFHLHTTWCCYPHPSWLITNRWESSDFSPEVWLPNPHSQPWNSSLGTVLCEVHFHCIYRKMDPFFYASTSLHRLLPVTHLFCFSYRSSNREKIFNTQPSPNDRFISQSLPGAATIPFSDLTLESKLLGICRITLLLPDSHLPSMILPHWVSEVWAWDFPGGPVVSTIMQGVCVWSLVEN